MRAGDFQLLVISPERAFPEEVSWLHTLFEAGLSCFHLRKPGWSAGELLQFTRQVDADFHPRIMVHYQESLLREGAFRGVHYRKEALPPRKPVFPVSCGLHSWEAFRQLNRQFDYAFISPFFSSISKKGYAANKELWTIPAGLKREKAIALGGIKADNLKGVFKSGLGGAAVLGSIWESSNPLRAYLKLLEQLKKIESECPEQDLM